MIVLDELVELAPTDLYLEPLDADGVEEDVSLSNVEYRVRYWYEGDLLSGATFSREVSGVKDIPNNRVIASLPVGNLQNKVGLYRAGEVSYDWIKRDTGTGKEWPTRKVVRRKVRAQAPAVQP